MKPSRPYAVLHLPYLVYCAVCFTVLGLAVLGIYSLRTFDFAPQSYAIVAG